MTTNSLQPEEPRIAPCTQMRTLLSQMADGTLRGLLRRYAQAHIARCAHCQEALSAIERVVRQLRHLPEETQEETARGLEEARWETVQQAMRDAEMKKTAASA